VGRVDANVYPRDLSREIASSRSSRCVAREFKDAAYARVAMETRTRMLSEMLHEADEDYALFSPTESFDSSRSTRDSSRRRAEADRKRLISFVTRRNGFCIRGVLIIYLQL